MGTSAGRRIHDDPFNYMVEEVREDGSRKESLGGSVNAVAAKHLFETMLYYRGTNDLIQLRTGGRIISREQGNGGERKAVMDRLGLSGQSGAKAPKS